MALFVRHSHVPFTSRDRSQLFLEALHARKYEVLRRLVGAGIMDEPAFAIEVLPVLLARTERLPAYLYVHPSSNRLPAAAVTAGVTAVVGSSAGSGTGRGAETTDTDGA